jgi:hypothetical protein
MGIIKAIDRAYRTKEERKWDTIYWAVDLHGVCLKSNYEQGEYEWINDRCVEALRIVTQRPETKIILWSSVYDEEKVAIGEFFNKEYIPVWGFNTNPWENDTHVSCFDEKFYFSVLLDDKAGFDPEADWQAIIDYFKRKDEIMDGQIKPIVQYIAKDGDYIAIGHRAEIYAVDHPRLGEQYISTSRVINIDEATGVFETLNTVYKPVQLLNG